MKESYSRKQKRVRDLQFFFSVEQTFHIKVNIADRVYSLHWPVPQRYQELSAVKSWVVHALLVTHEATCTLCSLVPRLSSQLFLTKKSWAESLGLRPYVMCEKDMCSQN